MILEYMPLELRKRVSTASEGKGSLFVVLQIVLCSGITAMTGNRTPVAQSTARNISDHPKQKRTLKLAITTLILIPTLCIALLEPETRHTYQIQRLQV